MSERPPGSERGERKPMMKIDDATYGRPPKKRWKRTLARTKRWFLLEVNRWVMTALLLVGVFLCIVLVGSYGPVSVQSFLTEGVSPGAVLVELLKTIVSVVVIVLSINQLVLSPGLGPVDDQETRFQDSIQLRARMERLTGTKVSPSSPAEFLRIVVTALVLQARHLRDVTEDSPNGELRTETAEFVSEVLNEATPVQSELDGSRFGTFDVIPSVLRFSISEKFHDIRAVRQKHEATFSDEETEAFEEMDELLELFTVSREYLKTVYIRAEYVNLSEGLLFIGLPSLVLTYCATQIYAPSVFPGETLGFENLLLFVSLAVSVSLAPLALLVAYVFRLAAMSRSTLFVGPFTVQSGDE